MAEVAWTKESERDQGRAGRAYVISWDDVTEADTFKKFECPANADLSVHVGGTDGGGTVVIKGSNYSDASGPLGLKDVFGNALSFTAPAIAQIAENAMFVIPTHSGGTSATVDVKLLVYEK